MHALWRCVLENMIMVTTSNTWLYMKVNLWYFPALNSLKISLKVTCKTVKQDWRVFKFKYILDVFKDPKNGMCIVWDGVFGEVFSKRKKHRCCVSQYTPWTFLVPKLVLPLVCNIGLYLPTSAKASVNFPVLGPSAPECCSVLILCRSSWWVLWLLEGKETYNELPATAVPRTFF